MSEPRKRRRYEPLHVERATLWVRPQVLERAKNAVAALSREMQLSLTTVVNDALKREVDRLERLHNGRQPFPRRSGELKRGARSRHVQT